LTALSPASSPEDELTDQVRDAVEIALTRGLRLAVTLDGGLVPDMQAMLDELGIWGVPLLGGTFPRVQIDAGPWLILPDRAPLDPVAAMDLAVGAPETDPDARSDALARAALEAMDAGDETGGGLFGAVSIMPKDDAETHYALALLIERHAHLGPVFWALPAGNFAADGAVDECAETLCRHLRGLNLIRLARRPRPRHPVVEGYEEVGFRHADGQVLAALVPLLRPEQIARMLGAAQALFAVVPDLSDLPDGAASHVIHVDPPSPEDIEMKLFEADAPLTLDARQVDLLEDARAAPLDAAIARHLTQADPAVAEMPPEHVGERVRDLRRGVIARTPLRADRHVIDLVEIVWHHDVRVLDRPDVVATLDRPGWSQEKNA